MREIRDSIVHGLVGVVGLAFGILSGIALVIAAVIPASLGLLAFAAAPLRALVEHLQRP